MNNLVGRVIKLLSYADHIFGFFCSPDNFFLRITLLSFTPCSWLHGNVLLESTFPVTPIWNVKYGTLEEEASIDEASFLSTLGREPTFSSVYLSVPPLTLIKP